MKKLNLFSRMCSPRVGSQKDDGSSRLRVVFDSFTCRLRVLPLKLVSVLAILLTIGVGNVWGATGAITASSEIIIPAGSTTNITKSYWSGAGAPAYSTSNDFVKDITISSTKIGSLRFYHAGYDSDASKWCGLATGGGYLETVITSTNGVDVVVYCKRGGSKSGNVTVTLTGGTTKTTTGTSWATLSTGTTSTTATLKIENGKGNQGIVGYIKITPKAGGGSTCATPTFSPAAGTYCGSQSVTISSSTTGSTIYYTTDGSTPTTGSSHGTAGAANASVTVSSSQTLKAIAVKDGLTNSTAASASYTINNIANTQETAYTVAEARALIDAGTCLTQQVYVKGYVSEIVTAFNGTYGNISFNITDNSDGTGDTFEFYRNFKGPNNNKWTSAEEAPQVGNYVVGYGTLTKYSSTYEFAEGNYCVVNTGYTITAVSNNDSYGTVSLTGKVITATPESGYRVSTTTAYNVTSGTATVVNNGDNTFTVTPTSDCTVRINFEAIPTHNVIFNTGGLVSIPNASVYEGETYAITETPAASLTVDCEYHTFVGWTTVSSIADESVRPSIVSSVEMSTSDITLYAVYSKTSDGGGSGDYELVENDLDTDWAGDYLIAYSSTIFADGRVGGTGDGGIGAQSNQVDPSTNLTGKVVAASWGDTYYVTLEEISSGSNTYVLKTQDGKYNYQTTNANGLKSTETKATAANYPITVTYTSSSDIKLCLGGEASGAVFRWNDAVVGSGGQVFRFYKNGGQNAVYLYKKSSGSTTYSLEPNCSAPTIIVNPTSLAFADTKVDGSSTMTFTVRGSNLISNISLAVSGTNADMFSIDKTSLTPSEGSVTTTTVTVTYAPTSAGSHSAEINLTSTDAMTKTVHLTGAGKWEVTWMKDGEVYETTLVANGTKPTLPDTPTSFDATSNEFYGWATAEWKGRIDDLEGKTVYTSSEAMSTVNTNGRVYYAVFAKPEGAPYNTLIWAEDFSGYSANDVPDGSIDDSHTGTTLYGGGSVTYGCTSGSGGSTKIYEETSAGGTSPELLISKKSGTFSVSGLPKAGAAEMTISYKQNGQNLTTSVSGTDYDGGGHSAVAGTTSFTITCGSDETFNLTFTGPAGDKNVRIDDIELRLKRAASYCRFMTNSREDIYVTSAEDIMTQASMTMNINRSKIKSGSVSIADAAGSQGGAFHAEITNGTADAEDGLNATVQIQYTPTQANVSETATMTVAIGDVDSYTFTVYGRSLPETFAIVGKVGAVWTALPADALSSGLHAGYGLTVDNADAPTEATLAPEAALYKYYARTTKGADYIRLAGSENNKALWSSSSNGIKVWAAIGGGSATGDSYEWQLATTDNTTYTLWNKAANSGAGRNLGINSDKKWGMHATAATNELRFLPVTSTATYIAMNVTNWGATTFTFTTGDVIPSYSSITVLYGDESFSATMSGSGTYTLNISGIDFSAHSGEQLVVQWKDGSGNAVAQGAVITPIFISSANTNFEGYDIDILPTNDVLITNGATLTITANNLSVRNLTVESGSTLNISTAGGGTGVTFHMNSLSLRGGWTTINDEQTYDMPRVYINPASTLTKTQTTVNMDISVNKNNYYPFAVPFPVAVSAVDYADSYLASHSTYGTHYVIKKYNGENRAINGPVDANWVVVESGETLQPGTGYILTAVPVAGEAVIRFPMNFANTWTTGGEQGSITVDAVTTTKNVIPVSAYSGAAATEDKRHAGWNLLGVPFMACYQTDDGMHNEADGFLTGKMTLSGDPSDPYDWAEDGTIYVSVPTHDFSEYIQFDITDEDTKLLPGWCFFMQIAKDGNLTFDVSDQQSSSDLPIYAPKHTNDNKPVVKTGIILSGEESSDKTTFLISDKYNAGYEIGADLEKMFGEGYTLATYSLSSDTRLAYNAMSTTDAKQVIPIGFRAPADGEYTFSLNGKYADADIERVDLIDYQTGTLTDLMNEDYSFTTTRTQDDKRFALNIVQANKVVTGNETLQADINDSYKVLLNGTMYIVHDKQMYDVTGKRVNVIGK